MSPDALAIVKALGSGAATEMRFIGVFVGKGATYDEAVTRTKNSIVEAFSAGAIVMPAPGIYALPPIHPTVADHSPAQQPLKQ